jgi:hypothetical protein
VSGVLQSGEWVLRCRPRRRTTAARRQPDPSVRGDTHSSPSMMTGGVGGERGWVVRERMRVQSGVVGVGCDRGDEGARSTDGVA